MSLTKSRKILSFILTLLLAAGGTMFFSAQIVRHTLCNENYIASFFSSNSVNNVCEQNFRDRIEAISAKSGIPSRVFEAILENNSPTPETAVRNIFRYNNAEIYSEDLIGQFESLCTEYLDGNNIAYDKAMIHNTAVYAAQIYSDCFGIIHFGEVTAFFEKVDANYGKFASAGLLLVVIPLVLFLVLYSKRSDNTKVICSAFTALGISLFLIGLCGLIFSAVSSPLISPDIYARTISKAVSGAFGVSAIIGMLIGGGAFVGSLRHYKSRKNNII